VRSLVLLLHLLTGGVVVVVLVVIGVLVVLVVVPLVAYGRVVVPNKGVLLLVVVRVVGVDLSPSLVAGLAGFSIVLSLVVAPRPAAALLLSLCPVLRFARARAAKLLILRSGLTATPVFSVVSVVVVASVPTGALSLLRSTSSCSMMGRTWSGITHKYCEVNMCNVTRAHMKVL